MRALIAVAASSRAGVDRDAVIDALWPRHSDAAARNRLYHTMHLIRRAFGSLAWHDDWIYLDQGRVQLDPRIDCDAARLDAAASTRLDLIRDVELTEIVQAWQGDWAPDVDAGGLGHTIRRHLRDCHSALVHEAALRHSQLGDTPARRNLLDCALRLNATDEWAYRELMQLDLDAQRPHAVLRTFDAASREMVQQLGLRSSQALRELAARAVALLQSDPTAEIALAIPNTNMVGREVLASQFTKELNDQPGVWCLSGLSGVGKTTLMRQVARRVGPMRADGARFISLGDHAIESAAIPTILRASGFATDAALTAEDALQGLLRTRDVLLIIDDLTSILGWQQLLDLLDGPLAARVVLVTHSPVNHAGVRQLLLPPLNTAQLGEPLTQARLSPSVTLFQMRRKAMADTDLAEDDVREVIELVRRLDGLPLAIELAAAQTATMTPGEILRRLDSGQLPSRLSHESTTAPKAQRDERRLSVDSALDVTFALLSDAARRAYYVAAVFNAAFTADEFCTVDKAVPAFPQAPVGMGIGMGIGIGMSMGMAELVATGVVAVEESGAFRMLHLPRAHACRHAQAGGLWPHIETARIDQIVAALACGETHCESPGYTAWMQSVVGLHDSALNLLNSAQRADEDDRRFLRLLLPLTQLWSLRRHRHAPFAWFERGLKAARTLGDVRSEMLVLLAMTNTLLALKRVEEALDHSGAAMRLAASSDDAVTAAMTIAMRANALYAGGHHRNALELLDKWVVLMPAGAAGHATLAAALILKGRQVAGMTPRDPAWSDCEALKARYAGSLAWRDLLIAVGDCVTTLSPQTHLAIADELRLVARDMQTPLLGQHAQYRRAVALLLMERPVDAAAAAREWHRLASGAGLAPSTGMACLFLAEMNWRADDTAGALQWLAEVPVLTPGGRQEDAVIYAHTLMRSIVAALVGDARAAAGHYARMTRATLAELRWPSLELAVECAALVAKGHGENLLFQSLTDALVLVSDPNVHVPITWSFRERQFGVVGTQTKTLDAESAEAACARACEALCALFDRLTETHKP